jgi:hypothetical protein
MPGLPLGTRGGILAKVDLPSDGEYAVSIADIVTHIWGNGMEFANPVVVVNKPGGGQAIAFSYLGVAFGGDGERKHGDDRRCWYLHNTCLADG